MKKQFYINHGSHLKDFLSNADLFTFTKWFFKGKMFCVAPKFGVIAPNKCFLKVKLSFRDIASEAFLR